MKNWTDMIKNVTMLTQFGLSFVTPLLLCLAACWWLTVRELSCAGIMRWKRI